MMNRLLVSLSLALMGTMALTAPSYAASFDDLGKTDIIVGTFVVVLILMAILFVVYLIKHALGLDKVSPDAMPEPAEPHH